MKRYVVRILAVLLLLPAAAADIAAEAWKLPRTGQAASAAAGDDGETRAGAAWPAPRFVDKGDGTVVDAVTGLVWQRQPSSAKRNWANALAYCRELALGGVKDWRLPNVNELAVLCDKSAPVVSDSLNSSGFAGILAQDYWTSTTYAPNTGHAWNVGLDDGEIYHAHKSSSACVWAVRGDGNAARTGQARSYADGDDAGLKKGIPWPDPRFTDNGDGTVTDALTGLSWEQKPSTKTMVWQDAVSWCRGLSVGGHGDWRLPNSNELSSLMNRDVIAPARWLVKQGFSDLLNGFYWTSTTYAPNPINAWAAGLASGSLSGTSKAHGSYVLAVRGGR